MHFIVVILKVCFRYSKTAVADFLFLYFFAYSIYQLSYIVFWPLFLYQVKKYLLSALSAAFVIVSIEWKSHPVFCHNVYVFRLRVTVYYLYHYLSL